MSLANLCEGLWNRRRAFFDLIDADARQRVRVDLLEIAIFTAAAHPAAAERILDDATASLGESPAIEAERRRHLGLSARSPWPAQSVAHTSWEHFATGRALMMSGDLIAADAHLRSAVALDPAGPWSNFYHGLCAHRLGQYNEAALAFSICIGADPSVRSFYFNRSLAHAAAGRAIEAAADHAEGVRLGSSFRP